jgi:hypothetical protein
MMPRQRLISVPSVRRSPLFCAAVLAAAGGFLAVPLYFAISPAARLPRASARPRPGGARARAPPPSAAFLGRLPPLLAPAYEAMYGLTPAFASVLASAAASAPADAPGGRRRLMFTIFDSAHIALAMNLYCSSAAVGLDRAFHLFIALDARAHRAMRAVNPAAVLLDVEARAFRYEQFCKFKLVVHYHLLLLGVDTTICDDDAVFLRSPLELLADGVDVQVASEGGDRDFGPAFDHLQFNVGFLRVVPSELTIELYNRWLREAIPDSHRLDQAVLAQLLAPYRLARQPGPTQSYQMRELLGRDALLRVMWFDPLAVANGLVYYMESALTRPFAVLRGIVQPHVVHLAWIQQEDKMAVLKAKELWVLDGEKCGSKKQMPREWE